MIEVLEAFFASRTGVIAGFLFGSQAQGRAHVESDIDVAVLLDAGAFPTATDRSRERVRMISDLMGALGRNDVDVAILNDIPFGLAREIVIEGRRIYASDQRTTRDFIREAQLRAADLDPFLDRLRRRSLEILAR